MTEQQIRKIVREIVREELDYLSRDYLQDIITEAVSKELLSRENFSNLSLTEYLTRLGIIGCKNFAGMESIVFAITQYLENGLKPSKKLYDLLKGNGLSERELRYAKEMAFYSQTPLYRQVFSSLPKTTRPPTNTQFIILAANFYAARVAQNQKIESQ